MADYIASVSGGKDSAAMCLHLKEQGIEHRRVFFDTGWEHPVLYEYLRDELPEAIGSIEWVTAPLPELDEERESLALKYEERLGHTSAMIRWTVKKAMFPSRKRRWCTDYLKIQALKHFMKREQLELPVNTVGVRAEESAARAKLPERELSTAMDCMVWRPLLNWTKQDVIDIHTRHQLRPCRLYLEGANRVGCWPCIFCRKSEIRFLAETDSSRVDLLRDLEADISKLCGSQRAFLRKGDGVCGVDETVEWSKTSRGGTQFSMFREDQIEPSCMSWGLCDTGAE